MEKNFQIFLSYSRVDEERVAVICKKLTDAGFHPWMDQSSLRGGEDWKTSIEKAIRGSDLFLAFLSEKAVNKIGFFQYELKIALDVINYLPRAHRYLMPVRLEECALPDELDRFQWVDLFEDDGWQRLILDIENAIKIKRREIPPRPTMPKQDRNLWKGFVHGARLQRYWPLFLLLLVPLAYWVIQHLRPQPPPKITVQPRVKSEDKLDIAITNFVGFESFDWAESLNDRLYNKLLQKVYQQVPINPFKCKYVVKPSGEHVEDSDEKQFAQSIGIKPDINSHVVLWGKIVPSSGGKYEIFSHLQPVQKLRARQFGDNQLLPAELDDFPFSTYVTPNDDLDYVKDLTDIVLMACGLSYYEIGELDEAIKTFSGVESRKEAYFYKGLCLYENAQRGIDTEANLEAAIEAFQRIFPQNDNEYDSLDDKGKVLFGKALINAANAYTALGKYLCGPSAQSNLRIAVGIYENIRKDYEKEDKPVPWIVQNNYGVALYESGIQLPGDQDQLEKAVSAFDAALSTCESLDRPEDPEGAKAMSLSNKGSAQAMLARQNSNASAALDLLEKAETNFNNALAIRTEEDSAEQRATRTIKLINTLADRAILKGPDGGKQMLSDAVKQYQTILESKDVADNRLEKALANHNLGNAFYHLGKLEEDDQKAIDLLRQAVDADKLAFTILEEIGPSLQTANTQNAFGLALQELGRRAGGKEEIEYLGEAIKRFKSSLLFYKSRNCPQDNRLLLAAQRRLNSLPRPN